MENLFSFLGYMLFGKHWVLWNMLQGLKAAIFVNEVEVEMHRSKIRRFQDERKALEDEMTETDKLLVGASGEERSKLQNRKEDLIGLMRAKDDDISGADGELQRIYNITYHNRLKYDFVKGYRIHKSYTDAKHDD